MNLCLRVCTFVAVLCIGSVASADYWEASEAKAEAEQQLILHTAALEDLGDYHDQTVADFGVVWSHWWTQFYPVYGSVEEVEDQIENAIDDMDDAVAIKLAARNMMEWAWNWYQDGVAHFNNGEWLLAESSFDLVVITLSLPVETTLPSTGGTWTSDSTSAAMLDALIFYVGAEGHITVAEQIMMDIEMGL